MRCRSLRFTGSVESLNLNNGNSERRKDRNKLPTTRFSRAELDAWYVAGFAGSRLPEIFIYTQKILTIDLVAGGWGAVSLLVSALCGLHGGLVLLGIHDNDSVREGGLGAVLALGVVGKHNLQAHTQHSCKHEAVTSVSVYQQKARACKSK